MDLRKLVQSIVKSSELSKRSLDQVRLFMSLVIFVADSNPTAMTIFRFVNIFVAAANLVLGVFGLAFGHGALAMLLVTLLSYGVHAIVLVLELILFFVKRR